MSVGAVLSIGEVANRTGVPVPTLRVWERRFAFPSPERQPSGHRRYTEADCEQIAQVVAEREAGRSLAAAIDRVRRTAGRDEDSVVGFLRAQPTVAAPSLLTRRTMRALSHAIEDEASAAGGRGVLVAAFQTEAAYARARHRWDDLAAGADVAAVLAAFARPVPSGRTRAGPVELCLPAGSPLRHEWVVAGHGPGFTACLAGWERPTPEGTPDHERLFEATWTVDPALVRTAVTVMLEADPAVDHALLDRAAHALDRPVRPGTGDVAAAVALANRMVAYAAR
jgi:DNA-binding transcriptional MerR regulator